MGGEVLIPLIASTEILRHYLWTKKRGAVQQESITGSAPEQGEAIAFIA
jgi:hypothetical protein